MIESCTYVCSRTRPGSIAIDNQCGAAGCHVALPLVAVLRHTHQRLPVSLVSIGPEGVATASHEGNIHRYIFQPPASPSNVDSHLRRIFSRTADDTDLGRSQGRDKAQNGSSAGNEGAPQGLAGSKCVGKERGHIADRLESSTASPGCLGSSIAHQGAGSLEVATSPVLLMDVNLPVQRGSALPARHHLDIQWMVYLHLWSSTSHSVWGETGNPSSIR